MATITYSVDTTDPDSIRDALFALQGLKAAFVNHVTLAPDHYGHGPRLKITDAVVKQVRELVNRMVTDHDAAEAVRDHLKSLGLTKVTDAEPGQLPALHEWLTAELAKLEGVRERGGSASSRLVGHDDPRDECRR